MVSVGWGVCLRLTMQTFDKLVTNFWQTCDKPNHTVNKLINHISAILIITKHIEWNEIEVEIKQLSRLCLFALFIDIFVSLFSLPCMCFLCCYVCICICSCLTVCNDICLFVFCLLLVMRVGTAGCWQPVFNYTAVRLSKWV